jgi:hypothetical protein
MVERNFSQIEGLKQQLLDLGYYQFQIDSMIREVVNTTQLEKLSPKELVELTEALLAHIDFAQKCQNN